MSWFGGVMNGNNSAHELEWTTDANSATVLIDKDPVANADQNHIWIDWGDGTPYQKVSDIISSDNIDHTYATAGTYVMRTWQQDWDYTNAASSSWSYERLGSNNPGTNVSLSHKINSFGLINQCNVNYGRHLYSNNANQNNYQNFWNSENLQNYPINLTAVNTDFELRLSHMHYDFLNSATENNPTMDMRQWFELESPTRFYRFFRFNKRWNPLLGKWNMSSLTSLYQAFWESIAWTGIGIEEWDLSSVQSFQRAFQTCTVFNGNIGGWSMASQTDMRFMFEDCSALNQDISAWGTNDGGMNTSSADFRDMLDNTAMSVENYSKWIICLANWAFDNSYTTAETLGGVGLSYDSTTYSGIGSDEYTDATAAATYLEGLGWTIGGTDLG